MDNSNDRFKVINPHTGITPKKKFKRKIAAIMSADVQGYSKLMGNNEERTVTTITEYRQIFFRKVNEHSGIVVDSPGDNILSEFGSAVDAVNCAIEIQAEIKERNSKLEKKYRMKFRIGINLGDVIEDENRLYGDGINIAARLESLAKGGGIFISGTVYDHVKDKMNLDVAYLGGQTVKNIKHPVRTYELIVNKSGLSFKREYKAILFFLLSIISIYFFFILHLRFIIADNGIIPFQVLNPIELIQTYIILSIPPILVGIGFIIYVLVRKGIDTRLLRFLKAFSYGGITAVLLIILVSHLPGVDHFGFQNIYGSNHSFVVIEANNVNVYTALDLNSQPLEVLTSGKVMMLSDEKQSTLNQWNKVLFIDNRNAWINKYDVDGNQVISIKMYSIKYSDLVCVVLGILIGLIAFRRKIL